MTQKKKVAKKLTPEQNIRSLEKYIDRLHASIRLSDLAFDQLKRDSEHMKYRAMSLLEDKDREIAYLKHIISDGATLLNSIIRYNTALYKLTCIEDVEKGYR